ncbi:hypothetical protein ABEG63_00320 [Chryseobacterium sp. C39-AII1]|uniref:hypothetical protein n=1 Tax=Chryseobacterium sp. C39-AII1 TaxID=3080332 RepID=UPI003207C916
MKNASIRNNIVIFLILSNINIYSQTYNELKKDTADFFLIKADLNKDNVLDDVFISKPLYGDKLFFFINKKKVLETRNLSEDGGFIIKNITPIKNDGILKIETYFPDRGDSGAVHYIDFRKKQWILTKTMYYVNYWDKIAIECKCWVNQNILLKELLKPETVINGFPIEEKRKRNCSFTYPK